MSGPAEFLADCAGVRSDLADLMARDTALPGFAYWDVHEALQQLTGLGQPLDAADGVPSTKPWDDLLRAAISRLETSLEGDHPVVELAALGLAIRHLRLALAAMRNPDDTDKGRLKRDEP